VPVEEAALRGGGAVADVADDAGIGQLPPLPALLVGAGGGPTATATVFG